MTYRATVAMPWLPPALLFWFRLTLVSIGLMLLLLLAAP
jgi:hypothetical protein